MNLLQSNIFHSLVFVFGSVLLIIISLLVLVFDYTRFYTIFCLGFWLVFDSADYFLRRESSLSWFFQTKHLDALLFFLIGNTLFAFLVSHCQRG